MSKISPCLWFDGQAEEAAAFYVSLFPISRVDKVSRAPADFPSGSVGDVITVEFTLAGESYIGLNGGPLFKFTEAVSLSVDCADQAEVDRYWEAFLLLSGVVVGSFAGALMSAIIVLSDAPTVRNAFLWLLGGFGAASWQALGVFAAYAVLPLAAIGSSARSLDLLALGEEPAHHLGAEVERTRRLVYLCTALLTAASVAACGIIGFVGLVVPHAVRTIARPIHRTLLPLVFVGGGSFLVLSDVVSRTVVRPLELPVGVITALVGVPIFALLLRRSVA
jgi:iron complex transport system permease protein